MSSSKKPSQQPSQINLSAEIGQFISLNQEAFAELLTFIDFAEKFTLGLVEVNFPPDVDLLIAALQNNPDCENIQFFILKCVDANLRFLRDEIIKRLSEIELESNKKLVLIVRGLENAIGVFGEYPPVLQDLNFVRDAYKRTVPHPILFILPDYAITRLAKFAPDFWAWRSGIFRFKTPAITKENAINQVKNSEILDRIEPPEKQERIDLLHRLLMEEKPTGQQVTDGNLRSYSNILHQLGQAYLSHIKPEKAREYLEEAERISENLQDELFQAEVINTLGDTYSLQRQFNLGIKYYEKSLLIARRLENRLSEINALFKLGNAYLDLRQFSQAAKFYQQCLDIEQEIGDRYSQASTYHQLGIVAQNLREWEQAKTYYQQALDLKIEFGDRYSQASTYGQLGTLAEAQENYVEARLNLQTALEIYVEYKDEHWAGIARKILDELPE